MNVVVDEIQDEEDRLFIESRCLKKVMNFIHEYLNGEDEDEVNALRLLDGKMRG